MVEFITRLSASGAVMGSFDAAERLLRQFLSPERVVGIMDEIRGPAGRNMWEKLSHVQEDVLANYLKNEYPQTVAVVLSKLTTPVDRVLAILRGSGDRRRHPHAQDDPVQKDVMDRWSNAPHRVHLNLARTRATATPTR